MIQGRIQKIQKGVANAPSAHPYIRPCHRLFVNALAFNALLALLMIGYSWQFNEIPAHKQQSIQQYLREEP